MNTTDPKWEEITTQFHGPWSSGRADLDTAVSEFERGISSILLSIPASTVLIAAFKYIQQKKNFDPIRTLERALQNVAPSIEVRPARIGKTIIHRVTAGAGTRSRQALGIRWIISAARGRNERTFAEKIAGELIDASNNRGNAVRKRAIAQRLVRGRPVRIKPAGIVYFGVDAAPPRLVPIELQNALENFHFVPQATVLRLPHFFASAVHAPIVQGYDDLDEFEGLALELNGLTFAIMRHKGDTPGTSTIYLPFEIRDVQKITTQIDRILKAFKIPTSALTWQRADGVED